MPEGPEIAKEADRIRNYVKECNIIIGIYWDKNSRYSTRDDIKNFHLAVYPMIVEKVFSRGKLIIIQCKNHNKEKIFLVSHLGMSGHWTKNKYKHSNLWVQFGKREGEYWREVFKLYYDDTRKFGSFSIYKDLQELYDKNGRCLMSAALKKYKNINSEYAASKENFETFFKNKRLKNKKICEFLMEQKYVSGVGNYLRAEILHRCKIHPEKTLSSFSDKEIQILYNKTLEIIYKSYINQLEFQCYSQKCDKQGNSVETYKDSKKRTVHFVPKVQTKN